VPSPMRSGGAERIMEEIDNVFGDVDEGDIWGIVRIENSR